MKTITSKLPLAARILLGGLFAFSGLNKLLNFFPPPPLSGPTAEFMAGLMASGYLFPLLAITEVVAGALLLAGRYVPLGLTLLAPLLINIAGFHAALAPQGLPIVIVLLGLEIYLAWSYRSAFAPMLQAKAVPTSRETTPPARDFAHAS